MKAGSGTIATPTRARPRTSGTSRSRSAIPTSPHPGGRGLRARGQYRVEGQGDHIFAYKLARDTTKAGTYPVVLVSYLMACTKYADANTANLVKAYLTYVTGADGQKVAADKAGAAPLSDTLRTQITPSINAIGQGA